MNDRYCPWPGCGKNIPQSIWGCKRHWFMLPKDIRDWVLSTYEKGINMHLTPTRAYLDATKAAQDWIVDHQDL